MSQVVLTVITWTHMQDVDKETNELECPGSPRHGIIFIAFVRCGNHLRPTRFRSLPYFETFFLRWVAV